MANAGKKASSFAAMISFLHTSQEHVIPSSRDLTSIAIKVYAGELNKGIFIKLKHRDDEEYQLTHPSANVTGFISLRVHPYVTVQDYCVVTCPKTRLKALLRYVGEVKTNPVRLMA
jgi:hypothetical protein